MKKNYVYQVNQLMKYSEESTFTYTGWGINLFTSEDKARRFLLECVATEKGFNLHVEDKKTEFESDLHLVCDYSIKELNNNQNETGRILNVRRILTKVEVR